MPLSALTPGAASTGTRFSVKGRQRDRHTSMTIKVGPGVDAELNMRMIERVTIHEAGHAVISETVGLRVAMVLSVYRASDAIAGPIFNALKRQYAHIGYKVDGYCEIDRAQRHPFVMYDPRRRCYTEEAAKRNYAEKHAMSFYAGDLAEDVFLGGHYEDDVGGLDVESAAAQLRKVYTSEAAVAICRKRLESRILRMLWRSIIFTTVLSVASELKKCGHLTGEDLRRLIREQRGVR